MQFTVQTRRGKTYLHLFTVIKGVSGCCGMKSLLSKMQKIKAP